MDQIIRHADKIRLWDGQIITTRVINGFLSYPVLGKSLVTEYMMVSSSFEELNKHVAMLYEYMDKVWANVVNPPQSANEKQEVQAASEAEEEFDETN